MWKWAVRLLRAAFTATDTDHNGALSQDEFDKAVMIPAHVMFRILDANDDHQLSADELKSGGQILIREIRALRVPEAPNSISGRLNQAENSSAIPLCGRWLSHRCFRFGPSRPPRGR